MSVNDSVNDSGIVHKQVYPDFCQSQEVEMEVAAIIVRRCLQLAWLLLESCWNVLCSD